MSKLIISRIKDILTLFKTLFTIKTNKQQIEAFLENILNQLEVEFDQLYKNKVKNISETTDDKVVVINE